MLWYVLIQAITLFASVVFGSIAINIWEDSETLRGRILSGVFWGLALASILYCLCDVIFWHRVDTETASKIIIIISVIVFFYLAYCDDVQDKMRSGVVLVIGVFVWILIFLLIFNGIEKSIIYDEKVIEQSPEIQTQQYELIAASDGTDIEGNLSGDASGNFFLACGTISSNVNGEIKQTNVYKFYYVANSTTGEIRLMTVNADSTPIFYVEEDEQPYLLKKVSTPYSLDYNVEPAQKCNVGKETITYELHIPKGSIVGSFEFDNSN